MGFALLGILIIIIASVFGISMIGIWGAIERTENMVKKLEHARKLGWQEGFASCQKMHKMDNCDHAHIDIAERVCLDCGKYIG